MPAFPNVDQDVGKDANRLFERDDVLARLSNLCTSLLNGSGKTVALYGEAGIGKTSVLRALSSAASDKLLILQSGCEDLMTPRPFGPLYDIADLLDPDIIDMLADEQQQGKVLNQLLIAMKRTRQPIVMIIEDIHWADDATLDLIKFLGRRAATLPLLLIVSHRDDERESKYAIGKILGNIPAQDLQRIILDPLTPLAVTELARLAGRDGRDIHSATSGNPFFVTEILASRPDSSIPGSVRDAVWARLEKCPIEQRVALEALSIVPGSVRREMLGALMTPPQAEHLDLLVDAGMLTSTNGLIRFRHELARQSVLQLLPESRKRNLHRAAGEWLAQQANSDDMPILSQRLHHAHAGEDVATILALVPDAARRAARMGAHKQAAQFLALALPNASALPADEAAQLFESWSYESGLAEQISEEVIAARHSAIKLWEQVGRKEKIGLNYRWLSRLHWYRGEAEEAEQYVNQAISILETTEPGPELAWGYSVRSQWAMLNDKFEEAIIWGERAKALAKQFDEIEIYVHALNNIGTSLLLSTDAVRGRALMDESLALALDHQFHEQAARVYTNMAEYALSVRDLDMARTYIEAGVLFDTEHDLDSWLHYLRGCQARYLMMSGKLAEAEALARDVLDVPNQTMIMQLPAASVLAQLSARLDRPSAKEELDNVLKCALGTKEPQRIAPVRIARAEAAWLEGDMEAAFAQVKIALSENEIVQAWDVGELYCWAYRSGHPILPLPADLPRPVHLECSGELSAAAEAYRLMGMPFEQAIVLSIMDGLASINPRDAIDRIIKAIGQDAMSMPEPNNCVQTGIRDSSLGLTLKERQVLRLLGEGASNAEMAATLNRSIRTIEHHVSAVLGKLDVTNRNAAAARIRLEPDLVFEN